MFVFSHIPSLSATTNLVSSHIDGKIDVMRRTHSEEPRINSRKNIMELMELANCILQGRPENFSWTVDFIDRRSLALAASSGDNNDNHAVSIGEDEEREFHEATVDNDFEYEEGTNVAVLSDDMCRTMSSI